MDKVECIRHEDPFDRRDPTTGTEMNLDVDFIFTDDELRFAVLDADDTTPTQVHSMSKEMTAQMMPFLLHRSSLPRRR